jgi:hypothetical protein
MITRFTLAILIAVAATGSAAALISKDEATRATNQVVIEKNQAFPIVGPEVFEDCTTATCDEVKS